MPPPTHMVATMKRTPRRLPSRRACPTWRGTSHAVWVTHGDRATVHVDPVGIETQLISAVEGLGRESFVEFPQADVLAGQTGPP